MVEVVHRRSGHKAPPAEPAHATTWPEEFQGRSAPTLPPAEDPAVTPVPAPPVGHLMPGWEPLLPPLQPAEPAAKIPAGIRPRPRVRQAGAVEAPAEIDQACLCRSFRGGRHRDELHPLRLSRLAGTGEARPDDLPTVPIASGSRLTEESRLGFRSAGSSVQVWAMRTGIVVEVTAADRARLEAIVADRNSPQKHVWRAGSCC